MATYKKVVTESSANNIAENAATATLAEGATALATARAIGGVDFDGTAAINLPGVNAAGNQATSGLAATATALETGRTISTTGEVTVTTGAFDGSAVVTGAATIADGVVDEANLKISNSATDGLFLQYKDSTDELTWATPTDVSTVENLTDTTIGESPADNDVLSYNLITSKWENKTPGGAGLQAEFNETGSRVIVSAASGTIGASTITTNELAYLDVTTLGQSEQSKVLTADANGDVKIEDGAFDFDVASHDGTNGLLLGGTLVTTSATELNYVKDVSSAIQTQLDAKQATITGAATTIDTEDLTASVALVSDASGKVAVSAVTATELGYLDDVTSAIQTQLNAKTGDQTAADMASLFASSSAAVSFGGAVTVGGDLQVTGATVTTSTETISIADNTMVLNSDKADSADVDAGIVIERGADVGEGNTGYTNNKSLYWDEGLGKWAFGTSTTLGVGGTYQGDIASMDVNASYQSGSTVVPIGHFQYDTNSSTLYVRVT
jgi:hypothetical protein